MFDGPWWPRATGAGTGQVTASAKRRTIDKGVLNPGPNYTLSMAHPYQKLIIFFRGHDRHFDIHARHYLDYQNIQLLLLKSADLVIAIPTKMVPIKI